LQVWSDFSLDQLSPSYYSISKRTNASTKVNWVDHAGHGTRAAGLGYIGGATNGGIVFGLKGKSFAVHFPRSSVDMTCSDFWQGAPRSLEIRNAGSDTTNVALWAWSPQAPAMDMRHYDTVPHGVRFQSDELQHKPDGDFQLDLAYEDVGDPDPTPIGIGRSYEITLQLFPSTPSRADLAKLAEVLVGPSMVMVTSSLFVNVT
jgi:hypothetical protein